MFELYTTMFSLLSASASQETYYSHVAAIIVSLHLSSLIKAVPRAASRTTHSTFRLPLPTKGLQCLGYLVDGLGSLLTYQAAVGSCFLGYVSACTVAHRYNTASTVAELGLEGVLTNSHSRNCRHRQ